MRSAQKITTTNYIDFIYNQQHNLNANTTESFIEIYNFIELFLHEVLTDSALSFNTTRARFLYLVEEEKLGNLLKKAGSLVFNFHYKLFDQNCLVSHQEIELSLFVFQELYNYFTNEQISLIKEKDKIETLVSDKNFVIDKDRLDCCLKELKETKTKYGFPLYEILATNNNGDDITIYLWEEHKEPMFHRTFSEITHFLIVGRKIRFLNLSLSPNGYYMQNSSTSLVLEPDFIMDITSIAECFVKKDLVVPELFFLKFLKENSFNIAILKGGFINYLLDKIIVDGESGRIENSELINTFSTFLKNQYLKILEFTEHDFNKIITEVSATHINSLYNVVNYYKDNKITVEPSFISEEYGIQGRLDALVEHPDSPDIKTIFELKSGKAPDNIVWQNHYMQVLGYNMLLKSVYKNKRTGHSSILYSSSTKNPLRNVTTSDIGYSQILMCRNIIVGNLLNLATSTHITIYDILNRIKENSENLPSYLTDDVNEFNNIYNSLEHYEIQYINAFISFIIKEMIAQKIGYIDSSGIVRHGYSSLWNMSIFEKIKNKTILQNLTFKSVSGQLFEFEMADESEIGGFREGDLLLIYPADENVSSILHVPIFKCVLKKISPPSLRETISPPSLRGAGGSLPSNSLRISVQFRNDQLTENSLSKYESFYAEKDILETGYYSNISSLYSFFKIDKVKREVFFGLRKPRFSTENTSFTNTTLLDAILQKAASLQDYLLIQGPPGTGKTSKYLIAIIKQHLLLNKTPIVILAFTNRAVEEICHRLADNELKFMLLGTSQTDNENHISNCNMDNLLKTIKDTRVFVSTVANFQNEGLYLKRHIDTDLLIVDEASQLLEYQLIGIIAYFKRFILIGDHFQLPAISTQNIDNLHSDLTNIIGINSINESLFERLYRRCEEKQWVQAFFLLPEHFRMHKDIAELVNPFYNNKLIPGNERQLSVNEIRTFFIDTNETTHSRYNTEEALKTKKIITSIYEKYKDSFNENTIGVICTWRLQVNLITNIISDLPYANLISVDTVERFQGSERNVIIYSVAISNIEQIKNLQSLTADGKVDRKLNVAISRAKDMFYLLGNKNILINSLHYRNVIAKLSSTSPPL